MEQAPPHKIRLLHLVHSLLIGGAEIALYHYIKALGHEEYEHYVFCFGADGPVRNKIESIGVSVLIGKKRDSIKHPLKFGFSTLSLIRQLMIFIKTRHVQVIQSHSGHANQLGVAIGKLVGIPAFPTVHSTMAFVDPRNRWDFRVYLTKMVNVFTYNWAENVLAVSQEIKEIILRTYGLKDSKVLVLKNGIVFDDSLTKPADLKNVFPHSEKKMKVVAVGRLVALKCYDVLVKAVADVVNNGLDNILVMIAGDGEERPQLEDLIRKHEIGSYVKLLGMRHDVLELMKASDVFVIPSRYEGLSIAMIEAMACGLPVIASNSPGLREHIKNEENGILFLAKNHMELAESIIRLANDENLRSILSAGSKKSFLNEYDMRSNIKILDQLFKKYATSNCKSYRANYE